MTFPGWLHASLIEYEPGTWPPREMDTLCGKLLPPSEVQDWKNFVDLFTLPPYPPNFCPDCIAELQRQPNRLNWRERGE